MNRKLALAAGMVTLGLTSFSANAGHIGGLSLFDGQEFTFDGSAYGTPSTTPITAVAIDFSYQADVDQINTGATTASFTETGVAFFSAFQYPTLGSPVDALSSGLNAGYKMYLVFTGAGNIAGTPAGSVDGVFNSFNLTIYIDPDANTTGPISAGAGGMNGTTTVGGTTADDFAILTGVLSVGGFHVFPGLANGDFDVLFDITSYDSSIWGGAAFAGDLNGDGDFLDAGEAQTNGDLNGVNTSIVGLAGGPFATKHDIIITGSGNVALRTVPVPGVLGLLGAGLLGLGWVNGRSRKNA